MFFNDVIYLDDTVTPATRKEFTGTFHTVDKWGKGDLELHLNDKGVLTGHFTIEDIKFELKGAVSYTGNAFGFLLEPTNLVPCALVRIKLHGDGVSLESYIPEFNDLFDKEESEKVSFHRVAELSELEELLIGA
jgi:hypothetical protein